MKYQINLQAGFAMKCVPILLKHAGLFFRAGGIASLLILSLNVSMAQSNVDRATDTNGLSWVNPGNWALTNDVSSDGEDSLVSGTISDGESSDIGLVVEGPVTVRFQWRVSSELNGDLLTFYLDGESQDSITGDQDWASYEIELGSGEWELIWSYEKDGDTSAGFDAGFIDQVEFLRDTAVLLPLGIVADTGFRPETDGFAFPNYGNENNPVNLTPDEMRRLFGDRVVARLDGDRIILTPPARKWMEKQSAGMDGGHCEGLAVLSTLLHAKQVSLNSFGGRSVSALREDDRALQTEIAYWFVTQMTSPASQGIIRGSPVEILEKLIEVLRPGATDTYTIGVYAPPGIGGGHAVTPFAVENKGDGVFHVLVYDNNHPGKTRRLIIDKNRNRWELLLSINPGVAEKPWFGDASSQSLEIVPSAPRMLVQNCSFCEVEALQRQNFAGEGNVSEIYVDGNGVRLLITDVEGRRYGWDSDEFLTEIPNVAHRYVKSGGELWEDTPSPVYYIPSDEAFELRLDGSMLEEVTETAVTLIGDGFAIAVEDIYLESGEFDALEFTPDGTGVSYTSDAGESPDITLGFITDEADFEFTVAGLETDPGATINIDLDEDEESLTLSSEGNTQNAFYALSIVRYDDETEQEFYHDEIEMEPRDTLILEYGDWEGEADELQIKVDWFGDGTIDEEIELTDDEFTEFDDEDLGLVASRGDDGSVRVSWDAIDGSFVLEASQSLGEGGWTQVPLNQIIEDGNARAYVIQANGEGSNFYRLREVE